MLEREGGGHYYIAASIAIEISEPRHIELKGAWELLDTGGAVCMLAHLPQAGWNKAVQKKKVSGSGGAQGQEMVGLEDFTWASVKMASMS